MSDDADDNVVDLDVRIDEMGMRKVESGRGEFEGRIKRLGESSLSMMTQDGGYRWEGNAGVRFDGSGELDDRMKGRRDAGKCAANDRLQTFAFSSFLNTLDPLIELLLKQFIFYDVGKEGRGRKG